MRLEGKVALVTGAGGGIGRTELLMAFLDQAKEAAARVRLTSWICDTRPEMQAPEVVAFSARGGITAAYVTPE